MLKRILSVILSIVIIIGAVPIITSAQTDGAQSDADISAEDFSFAGTTSVGAMLAEELEDAAEVSEGNGNIVYSVEIEANSATAEISTSVSCTLFVGVYTEDSSTLLASGYTEVTPEDETVVLTLDTAAPEYFYVKAFLINKEDLAPVSEVYSSPLYTQEMQEFLNKTTDDFEEDRVINFDEDNTNNFAVLSDTAITIDENAQTNKVTYADTASQIYIIEDIDDTVSSLQVGDTLSFVYGSDPFVIKIGEITLDGTTATILGADAELEEVFDYVRFDGNTGITEGSVDESYCGEGVTFTGYKEPASAYGARAIEIGGNVGSNAEFEFDFKQVGDDNKNATLKGTVELNTTFSLKLYISLKYKYTEIKFDYKLTGSISVEGQRELEVPITKLSFSLAGVKAKLVPNFIFGINGSIELSGTLLKGTIGCGWYSDRGRVNLTSKPKFGASIKAEVKVYIGLRVTASVKVMEGSIADAQAEAELVAEADAVAEADSINLWGGERIHDCIFCVGGEIYARFTFSVSGKLLSNKDFSLNMEIAEAKYKFADFYWSATYGEADFTTCPHIKYRLDIAVTDDSGSALGQALVSADGESYYTDNNGTVFFYLSNGNYLVEASKEDHTSAIEKVSIRDGSESAEIELTYIPPKTIPRKIQNLSLGRYHSGVIDEAGNLYTWGKNNYGQLGVGTTTDSPFPIIAFRGAESVSLGNNHSALIATNRNLYLWGRNNYGQLGDGTTTDSLFKKKIMSNVAAVELGDGHSAAITETGDLYMWGYNGYGQIGDGTTDDCLTPKKIMSNVVSVCLGDLTTAAITESGDLYIWGYNRSGYNIPGTTSNQKKPYKVMSDVVSVSLGSYHNAAITNDGKLYTWGNNPYGQLGDGTTDVNRTPTVIMENVRSVALGYFHSAAITTNGDLYTWGRNTQGHLGIGTTGQLNPAPSLVLSDVVSVSLGYSHSAAITSNGDLFMWGCNDNGQVGNDSVYDQKTPVMITSQTAVSPLAATFSIAKAAEVMEESSFSDLEADTVYNFYIMKDRSAEDALSPDNLLYVDQAKTDSTGSVTFSYMNNGTDFDSAQKFVVKLKNPLPDAAASDMIVTATKDKLFLNINDKALSGSVFDSLTARFTVNSKDTYLVMRYEETDDGIVFSCDISGELADDSSVSVKLFANSGNVTYESEEYRYILFEARSDINIDGLFNAFDLTGLRRLLLKLNTDDTFKFDPNADGIINVADLIRIKKLLAS